MYMYVQVFYLIILYLALLNDIRSKNELLKTKSINNLIISMYNTDLSILSKWFLHSSISPKFF